MTEPAHPPTGRAPRSTAESLCWIVLAYTAAPVLTLLFSALGVTGWVRAQHAPAGCWMAFAIVGAAGPARVLPGGSAPGALVVLAWWGGVFYLEAAGRRVLRAEVSNRPAASTGHLPAGYDTWTGRS